MKKMYIVTGADGHLGGTVVRMLEQEDCLVRGLILPGEEGVNRGNVVYYRGDVRRRETLLPLFENTDDMEVTVIHTAGIIDISGKVTPLVYDVNVNGTKTIAGLSLEKQICLRQFRPCDPGKWGLRRDERGYGIFGKNGYGRICQNQGGSHQGGHGPG